MKGALLALACALGLVCAMGNWQFNVLGGRLFIYHLLEAVFVLIFLLRYLSARRTPALNSDAVSYVILSWSWMLVIALSGVIVLVTPVGSGALTHYMKGLTYAVTQALFLTALVAFLCELTSKERNSILRFFVAGVLLSCVYELMQTIGMKYGADFDAMIWDRISYNTMREADEAFIGRYAWSDFFRGTGFPGGPNAQAAYIAIVLPLLYVNALRFRPLLNTLFIVLGTVALLITMSRSGIVAVASALAVLLVLGDKRTAAISKPLIVVALLLAVPAVLLWDSISTLAGTRSFYDASRVSVYSNALEVLARYPLGIGFNNFSVADQAFSIGEANAHNNWLAFLVETGIVGLLCKVALFFFLCSRLVGNATLLRTAVLASTIGVATGALFNENLDLFCVELFIALFFVTAMLETEAPRSQSFESNRVSWPHDPSGPVTVPPATAGPL